MRLLLDESVPVRLRRYLPSHSVRTVVEMGWSGIKNGDLLRLAAASFDVFRLAGANDVNATLGAVQVGRSGVDVKEKLARPLES